MGLLSISLLVASVVYVLIRPPTWLAHRLLSQGRGTRHGMRITSGSPAPEKGRHHGGGDDVVDDADHDADHDAAPGIPKIEPSWEEHTTATTISSNGSTKSRSSSNAIGTAAMPPPPIPSMLRQTSPAGQTIADDDVDGPPTPKASAAAPVHAVPSFSLSDESDLQPPSSSSSSSSPIRPSPASMMPPPIPARQLPPTPGRLPTLPQFPAPNSAQRARGPVPDRGPSNPSSFSSASGALAPPPTHSSRPAKPNRKVTLEPGHSPLDWARISGPNADLRGIDPTSTSYLRVTPSMLKSQTGRKGKDAWMAINGRVYNITPYAAYHPGGIPELMRGAARDGTKLFGEVHPWVNYEAMLSACLVGLLVEEPDARAGSHESEMDQID
ncbi:hypothetical protein E4U43_000435 [Claviceps pusilla]|uniref:Cytochrome b5 heme-binding domain-containing protein n=1 Tax=Claviceps pusilla TaxID=123648 RepID=A0A9P7NA01_9HYPO|nr:hypothetical protein E4U43_000435 [Claviceps pusilla]